MNKNNKYNIGDFYVGELYLYTQFAGMTKGTYIPNGLEKIQTFSLSGAIHFQKDLLSRYIDWENGREYTGFLTIFYKQGNKYICLHDGNSYELNSPNIIDNLIPLNELLPKVDTNQISKINVEQALGLFDILFKKNIEDSKLYIGNSFPTKDFYVGDISLKERTPIEPNDDRVVYINLPHHIMLYKSSLEVYSYGKDNYTNAVYRCLFLRDGVDLYNINNNQFYNPHEDDFDSIINFQDYMRDFELKPIPDQLSIPKALRKFKKTL